MWRIGERPPDIEVSSEYSNKLSRTKHGLPFGKAWHPDATLPRVTGEALVSNKADVQCRRTSWNLLSNGGTHNDAGDTPPSRFN